MNFWQITLLAIIQGAAELLPVSSSAHVIVAEKLMGLDPTAPQLTLLLVMLHTGTMFAVIVYFWKSWRATYFSSASGFRTHVTHVLVATAGPGTGYPATGSRGIQLRVRSCPDSRGDLPGNSSTL